MTKASKTRISSALSLARALFLFSHFLFFFKFYHTPISFHNPISSGSHPIFHFGVKLILSYEPKVVSRSSFLIGNLKRIEFYWESRHVGVKIWACWCKILGKINFFDSQTKKIWAAKFSRYPNKQPNFLGSQTRKKKFSVAKQKKSGQPNFVLV